MAEGFSRALGMNSSSAGTFPAVRVNSFVVEAMEEVGVDVSQSKPRELTERMIDDADVVVLTDASLEQAIPSKFRKKMRKKAVQWSIPDPQGRSIEEIRYARDRIREMVEKLARESGAAES
jgi:arsenate reductase